MIVEAGSLGDPPILMPAMHVWTGGAQPWTQTSGKLPNHPRNRF